MKNSVTLLATVAASFASARLQTASGGALVINYCDEEVSLNNVPAISSNCPENGTPENKTLAPGNQGEDSSYFQPWTSLLVDGGWSIKINTLDNTKNEMQFEYTWLGGETVWNDMSFVDGTEKEHLPWKFICPGQDMTDAAYQFPDDNTKMQKPVPASETLTLALCPAIGTATPSNSNSNSGGYIAPSPSAPAPTYAAPSTTEAPSTTFATTTSSPAPANYGSDDSSNNNNVVAAAVATPAVANDDGVATVTEYATQVVTAVVTETAHAKRRRHEHRHPHGHKLF